MLHSSSDSMDEQEGHEALSVSPDYDLRTSKQRRWRDEGGEEEDGAPQFQQPDLLAAHGSHMLSACKAHKAVQGKGLAAGQSVVSNNQEQQTREVVSFAKLDPRTESHADFLAAARPAKSLSGRADDGMTHEIFAVITAHFDSDEQEELQGLWRRILSFAARLGVNYKGLHQHDHIWSPFVEQLLRAFQFSGHYGYTAYHKALCVGIGSKRQDRQRAAALGAVAWRALNEHEHLTEAMQDEGGIGPFFVTLSNTPISAGMRDLIWNGVRMKMVLVRCRESAAEQAGKLPGRPSPQGLNPNASLGSVEDFVGVVPDLRPNEVENDPPWQKRGDSSRKDRDADRPWHRNLGKQRACLRKGPATAKSLSTSRVGHTHSSKVSQVEFNTKGRWSGKESSGPAARLVKRSHDAKKHLNRVPPAPPPPPRPSITSYDDNTFGGARRPRSSLACSTSLGNHPVGEKRIPRQKQRAVITRYHDSGHSTHAPRW